MHGTYSNYMNRKCRCEECKAACREYRAARRTGLPEGDPRHGTTNGYVNFGCRCDQCRKAMADYSRETGAGRKSFLKRSYGLTVEQWDEIWGSQEGKCAICGDIPDPEAKRRFHVDHNHTTGTVRGILCHSCNVALGHSKESKEILQAMISYLDYWDSPPF